MKECDDAFQNLKPNLSNPLILSTFKPGKGLFMYLAVPKHAVSVVLLGVHDGVQKLIYYISITLVDSKTQYLPLEKVAYAMRKLPHYFQAHTMYVLTEHLLQALLRRLDFTGRIDK